MKIPYNEKELTALAYVHSSTANGVPIPEIAQVLLSEYDMNDEEMRTFLEKIEANSDLTPEESEAAELLVLANISGLIYQGLSEGFKMKQAALEEILAIVAKARDALKASGSDALTKEEIEAEYEFWKAVTASFAYLRPIELRYREARQAVHKRRLLQRAYPNGRS